MTATLGIWIMLIGVTPGESDNPWELKWQNPAGPTNEMPILDREATQALQKFEAYDPRAAGVIKSTLKLARSSSIERARRFPTTPTYVPPPPNFGQAPRPAYGYYTPPPLGSGPARQPVAGYRAPYSPRQLSASRVSSMQGRLPQMPTALPAKPFSDYVPPAPLSHYDLYRYDNDFGAFNRYLAVPLARQQQLMNQTRANVQDLRSAAAYQQQNLQQLDRRTQPTHGTGAPGYFMNFRQYYPGFGQ